MSDKDWFSRKLDDPAIRDAFVIAEQDAEIAALRADRLRLLARVGVLEKGLRDSSSAGITLAADAVRAVGGIDGPEGKNDIARLACHTQVVDAVMAWRAKDDAACAALAPPECAACGGKGFVEVKVEGCTCGGVEIGPEGAGWIQHEPGCGTDGHTCPDCARVDVRETLVALYEAGRLQGLQDARALVGRSGGATMRDGHVDAAIARLAAPADPAPQQEHDRAQAAERAHADALAVWAAGRGHPRDCGTWRPRPHGEQAWPCTCGLDALLAAHIRRA